jgi:flagellar export protein FliJ
MAAPFRLARVLRLREQIRRLRTHETERLVARLAAVRVEARRVVAEREGRGVLEAQQAVAGTLTPEALHVGRAYDTALAAAERVHAEDLVRLGHALDAKRAELLHDRQEEEKYVRLAAAHRQRGLEDEARESGRSLDEIALDRYRRNQKERRHDQI